MGVYLWAEPTIYNGMLGYRPLQLDLKDESGNGKDASWYSGTGTFSTISGKTGARVTRDTSTANSTQHIITPIIYSKKEITIAGWINYDSNSMANQIWTGLASNADFADHSSATYTFYNFGQRGPDSYKTYCGLMENTLVGNTPTAGTRYSYMVSSTGDVLKFYLNGVLTTTINNYIGEDCSSTYRWRFGKWAGLVGTNGYIRHCALWNRALTDSEALDYYNLTN